MAQDQDVQTLLAELSGALADMVSTMNDHSVTQQEISSTLVAMLEAMEGRAVNQSYEVIAKAIRGIRIQAPAVNVNVSPTPIQNVMPPATVQILERVQPGDYELTVKYDQFDRIETARLTRIKL